MDGPYEILLEAGKAIPITNCTLIDIVDDEILEGDHAFSVGVSSVLPDGPVDASGAGNFTVTITDDMDGRHSKILL